MAITLSLRQIPHIPLLELINPREHTRTILLVAGGAVVVASAAVQLKWLPLWGAMLATLIIVMFAAIPKWRDDQRRYGTIAMILSILVASQGFHTVEHISQWIQYHILRWPFWQSSGLISPANAEWVHFVWNWVVLITVIVLFRGGMRGPWTWLLLLWAGAHTFEHTYLMMRYLQTLNDLHSLGVSDVAAQGLPGIIGRDGWLATSDATQNTFLCRLPGLATAQRLDVHFWWNIGEVTLVLPAANAYMASILKKSNASSDTVSL